MMGIAGGRLPFGTKEEMFEWVKVGASRTLPSGLVDIKSSVNPYADFLRDEMFMSITALVLAKKLPEHTATETKHVEINQPSSTWQFFKQRHAGAWWLRWFVTRRPVRTVLVDTVTVSLTATWEQMATYPWQTLAPQLDALGKPSRVVVLSTDMDVIRNGPGGTR